MKYYLLITMYYKLSCPVPKKQRPINEYIELIQSNFFNWPIQSNAIFLGKLFKNFTLFFLFFFTFFSSLSQSFRYFFLVNTICSCCFVFLIITRLLLAWSYVKKRLYNPSVFYEESGWYDGRVWPKSKTILLQDRFIYTYQVLPALKKLIKIIVLNTCFILCLSSLILLN